jgi:TolB protein
VTSTANSTVSRIDLKTRKVVATVRLPSAPTGLAAGQFGTVWVATGLRNSIVQIDPQTNRLLPNVELGGCCSGPSAIAVDGDTAWVANAIGTRRVRPGTEPVIATVPGTGSAGAVVDRSHKVLVSNGWDTVSVIDPFANTLFNSVKVPGGPTGLARGLGTDIWVAVSQAGEVARISPNKRTLAASIPVGRGPVSIAVGEGAVWVANAIDGTVSRVDPEKEEVAATIPVGRRLGEITFAEGVAWAAVLPQAPTVGARGRLVFDEHGDISVINADGTGRRKLTGGPEYDTDPDWSPDGTRIAFARAPAGPQGSFATAANAHESGVHLFVMKADGSGLRQLTRGPAPDFDVAWSRDGSRLAFHRGVSGTRGHLWVIKADGTGAQDLTPHLSGDVRNPDWSPDDETIVFRSDADVFDQLLTIRPDGTGLTQLSTDPGNKDGPAWSPDGIRIAYGGDQQGPGLYLTTPTAPAGFKLVRSVLDALPFPSWSPDGSKIAFGGTWDSPDDIYMINADGSGLVQLTHDGRAGIPDWQPDAGAT